MTLTNYPGHLVVMAAAMALAGLTFAAFYSAQTRAPARKWYRWPLILLQYAAILLLFVITWDPATLQTSEIFQRNAVVTLFDTSESMSVADQEKAARLDKAVEKFEVCFRPGDSDGPQYQIYGFDQQAYHSGSPELLRRWGAGTDLHAALALPARDGRAVDKGMAGVVVFTDGRAEDRNVRSYLPSLEKGTPVLLVGVGSRVPRTDVAIKSISAPARTWIDTAYSVAVTIAGANLSNEPLTIELLLDGRVTDSRRIARDQLKHAAGRPTSGEATLQFTVPAQQLGTHVLTARVAPLANEANMANNVRSTAVEVMQEQTLDVLLYAQQASFDVGKIRQALTWDKRVELDLRLDTIRDPVLAQRVSTGSPSVKFPESREQLNQFDVVILGPCDLSRFTSSQRDALYRFVTDRGGGLLLLPGPAVTSLAAWQGEPTDAILPVILDARNPRVLPPSPDTLALSFEARIGRVFSPADFANPEQSASPYYNIARTKPASTTLLTAGEAPIVTAHRLGRGRVCLLNAAKLFMLYREDQKGGLLGELICGLAAYLGASPSSGTGVELFAERSGADPRRAVFSAYVTDKDYQSVNEANVLLSVGDQVVTMEPAGEGRYTAELGLGPAESVVAVAQAEVNGTFLGERTLAANLPPIHDEMSETDLDEPFLKALAQQLDAKYLHVDSLDGRIAKMFTARQQVGSTQKVTSAWPRWPLLLLLCAILSVKWFLRRSIGLV